MNSETRTCQNCKSEFGIEPDDIAFYEKVGVPIPTRCPRCRNIARFAWREDRNLYKTTCALCHQETISIHAPESRFLIYCRPCYQSDKWDPMEYGRDYDFTKPFFEQYRELMRVVPQPALTGNSLTNSDYTQSSVGCKNCYLVFGTYHSEDSQYCFGLLLSKNTFDSYLADNSDHAYEALHCNQLYRVRFAYFADNCIDSSFVYDCVGCSYCFGCINLRKQKHCIFNKQLSKEEYKSQIAYWDLGSYKRLIEAKAKFQELYLSVPHRYANVTNSHNVSGDIIRDTNNCKMCFSALDDVENCKYLYFGGLNLKDSHDVAGAGDLSELLYNTMFVTRAQRSLCSAGSSYGTDICYSEWVHASSYVFGCIALKNKKYCVLNKQYSQNEYNDLTGKVKKHMDEMPYTDKRGHVYRYGDFFPMDFSTHPYNESLAFSWYPKTKDQALKEGLEWREPAHRHYETTLNAESLPDHIKDVDDSILKETMQCAHNGSCNEQCTTAFRLTKEELAFYRDMNIALPRLCWNCRFVERMRWRNRLDLYHRSCMCEGKQAHTTDGSRIYENTTKHFHGDSHCPNEFETTYSPDKPEMIYCEACYQAEFL